MKIAIATGDPGGIGPEISIKAALDIAGQNRASPVALIEAVERLAGAYQTPRSKFQVQSSKSKLEP
jgi:4-hydroxy-L-threonine phosphate dehydrogenase PdxA